jgi:hypothetical protein
LYIPYDLSNFDEPPRKAGAPVCGIRQYGDMRVGVYSSSAVASYPLLLIVCKIIGTELIIVRSLLTPGVKEMQDERR